MSIPINNTYNNQHNKKSNIAFGIKFDDHLAKQYFKEADPKVQKFIENKLDKIAENFDNPSGGDVFLYTTNGTFDKVISMEMRTAKGSPRGRYGCLGDLPKSMPTKTLIEPLEKRIDSFNKNLDLVRKKKLF